jgi:hypothetical protein
MNDAVNLSRKVVAVAAGEAHTLALTGALNHLHFVCYLFTFSLQPNRALHTWVVLWLAIAGDGCVYSWGRGMFGRLGTGSEADGLFPVRVNFDSRGRSKEERLKFVGVAAGAYHSLALAGYGFIHYFFLFSFSFLWISQLLFQKLINVTQFAIIPSVNKLQSPIHCLILTVFGKSMSIRINMAYCTKIKLFACFSLSLLTDVIFVDLPIFMFLGYFWLLGKCVLFVLSS